MRTRSVGARSWWLGAAVIAIASGCGSSSGDDTASSGAGAAAGTQGGTTSAGGASSGAHGGSSNAGTSSSAGGAAHGGSSANAGGSTSAGGSSTSGNGGSGGAVTIGSLTAWTSSVAKKIQPTTAPSTATSISVETYRDAYVSAQIGVTASSGALQGVTATVAGDLSDGAGHTLTKDDVVLFFESAIDFSSLDPNVGTGNSPVPASSPTMDARVPDPLVPLVDPYSGANAGQPFDVATGATQGLFVDVHVPKGLAAGTYGGSIHLDAMAGGSADVPISVTVWPIDLPDMRDVTTHFKMTINNLDQYHAGLDTCSNGECYEDFNKPGAAAILKRYEDLAHEHRIDTGQGLVNVPVNGCTPPADSDWATYDAQMEPYMSGSYFADGIPSGQFDVPFQPGQDFGIDGQCSESDYEALAKSWADHLTSKGWFPQPAGGGFGAVAYAYDEPLAASSDKSQVDAILQKIALNSSWLQNGNPAWKQHVIDTTSPIPPPADPSTSPLLDPALGVYVVALVLYDDFWDHGPFYGRTGWQTNPGLFNQGLAMWFYEGNSILPPYPTFATDTLDGLEPVIMMWGSWFEKATGFLYWDIANWDQKDPWGQETLFGKTGDGVLIYPGNHAGTLAPIGSPASVAIDGPIPSYRLKMIRQGLQDWSLFRMADKLGMTSFAQAQVSMVYSQFGAEGPAPAGSPYWTTDDAKMTAIRKAVAQAISGM